MDEQLNEDTIYLPGLTMEQRERRIITAALAHHNGDKKAAAGELGIGYSTLKRKLKGWKLDDQDDE